MKNWQYVLLITDVLYKGHSKRNEPEAFKEKRAGVWNVQTGDNIVARVTKSGSDKSAEVHCPPLEGHGCKPRDLKLALLRKFKWEVTLHTVQISLPAITQFLFLKKGSEGQTIHLGRRHQAVRAELVDNAAPGILRESHSPPSVAVG